MGRAVCMHPKDNVATVLSDVETGQNIEVEGAGKPLNIQAVEIVPFGHKIALAPIAAKNKIKKYGETIGIATSAIKAGMHVHVHNIKSSRR